MIPVPEPKPAAARSLTGLALAMLLAMIVPPLPAPAEDTAGTSRLYVPTDPNDSGAITGQIRSGTPTHVLAVNLQRNQVFLGGFDPAESRFEISNLPVGRYHVVLVSPTSIHEGLDLGAEPRLSATQDRNFQEHLDESEEFYPVRTLHRRGQDEDGRIMAVVERHRIQDEWFEGDPVRRIEIARFRPAGDDWQLYQTRHLCRIPVRGASRISFLNHQYVPQLSNLRVVGSEIDLGDLPIIIE